MCSCRCVCLCVLLIIRARSLVVARLVFKAQGPAGGEPSSNYRKKNDLKNTRGEQRDRIDSVDCGMKTLQCLLLV